MGPRIEWIETRERLTELAPQWAELAHRRAPFASHPWFSAWWDAFGEGRDLSVCAAWTGDSLTAVLPLMAAGHRLAPMVNDHTPRFPSIAADEDAMRAVIEAALDRGGWLELHGVPEGDPLLTAWSRSHAELEYESPTVSTAEEFEDWRLSSKKRWGAPLDRFRRRMHRDHQAAFSLVETPENLEVELRAGFEMEARGWKGRAGTAVISNPITERFYTEVANAFAQRGELRLSSVRLDGRLAAFDLCLLSDARLYLLKTCFNEDFRKLAPGLVLRLATVERCFELGLEAHDLLGLADGASGWKLKFATSVLPHHTVWLYGGGARGVTRYRLRRENARLHRMVHRVRRVAPRRKRDL